MRWCIRLLCHSTSEASSPCSEIVSAAIRAHPVTRLKVWWVSLPSLQWAYGRSIRYLIKQYTLLSFKARWHASAGSHEHLQHPPRRLVHACTGVDKDAWRAPALMQCTYLSIEAGMRYCMQCRELWLAEIKPLQSSIRDQSQFVDLDNHAARRSATVFFYIRKGGRSALLCHKQAQPKPGYIIPREVKRHDNRRKFSAHRLPIASTTSTIASSTAITSASPAIASTTAPGAWPSRSSALIASISACKVMGAALIAVPVASTPAWAPAAVSIPTPWPWRDHHFTPHETHYTG